MLQERAKTGVTVVHVSHKDRRLNLRKKHRREMSVRVTRVSQNSLSRIATIRSITRSDNKNINEKQKLSNHSNLKDMKTRPIPFDQHQPRTSSQTLICSSLIETSQISSFHKNKTKHPRLSIPSYGISFNKSFCSFDNQQSSIDLSKSQKSILENQEKQSERSIWGNTNSIFEKESKNRAYNFERNKKKKKERYRFCRICALCPNCCFALTIGALLFLAGIAALIIFLITNNHTTTTSFIASTTVTTASTTSITSTTSTTSTSTSTSSTTLTISTSSTSTTSTSTSSTTSTTSTTSDTTTTTTPTPPCTPNSVGSNSTLYSASPTNSSSYQCLAYDWTSPTTGLVTLAFQFRNVPGAWYLDDVSVYDGGSQMLSNGGFETGSLSPWNRTTPNGNCGGTPGQVTSTFPLTGNYSLEDGSFLCADQISQQFTATAGQIYVVSFWLKATGSGAGQTVLVTLS